MEHSIFLARVIGIISVISTSLILVRYKKSVYFDLQAVKNPVFVYVSGFVFIIIGVLITVSHPIFTYDWRLIITLLGLAVLVKGIGRVLFPDSVVKIIEKKKRNKWFVLGEILVFLLGLYLLYIGFIVY